MALSDLTSPTAVKHAIQECDRLGRENFLHHYGFGFAREYVLRYEGHEYDSKAIGCVAHYFENPELGVLKHVAGGKDAVGKRVFDLGFDVDGLIRRADDWTLRECEFAADAYFDCLNDKLQGRPFNRAQACREVAEKIGRSRGAVDYKWQNIDAILFKHGLPRMMNAVAKNTQKLLEYVVVDPLAERSHVYDSTFDAMPLPNTDEDVFVPVPEFLPRSNNAQRAEAVTSVKIDFAARDARNRQLGARGEEFVLALERETLRKRGLTDLADRVTWVSRDKGDGWGYDILSFDVEGQEKYIEVKTTNAGETTPFLITANEIAVADQKGKAYKLYRVFDLGSDPRVFVLEGPLTDRLHLEARLYSARPKPKGAAASA
jgi:hypothetical protein